MKKAIIIGASSGIGSELARILSEKGYEVGLTARREQLLLDLQDRLKGKSHIKVMDVADAPAARQRLQELIDEMGGMDLIVLNAGIGDAKATWEKELQIIDINVKGFVALANLAVDHFIERGGGHLVGVSSVASIRGTRIATVYSATKSFISNYMEGLRARANKKRWGIAVTDVRPGFVKTRMTEKNKNMFWVASAPKAAQQIFEAIKEKKDVAYITKRWILVATLLKLLPRSIYTKM